MKIVSKALLVAVLISAFAPASHSRGQAERASASGAGKTFALIVGISKYSKLPGGQQLQFADRDATLFADAIKKAGVRPENIRVLIGTEATAIAIKAALGNWLARSAAENDRVLFFFSGHGFYENEYGESYLLGYDSDPKDPFSTALSVSEINQAISRRVRSRNVLILADAMRKDFFDPEEIGSAAASFVRSFNQIAASREGISVITANGPGEFSREGQRWGGQGVFTQHLVTALSASSDRNKDGAITADEVFDVARSRIAEDTANKQHAWRSETALAQMTLSNGEPPSTPASIAKIEPVRKPAADQSPPINTVADSTPTNRASQTVALANKPAASEAPKSEAPKSEAPKSEAPKVDLAAKASEPAAKKVEIQPASAGETTASKPAITAPANSNPTPAKQPAMAERTADRSNQPAIKTPSSTVPVERNNPPSERRAPAPPDTQKVNSMPSAPPSSVIASTKTMESATATAPPRPEITPPSLGSVNAGAERSRPASVSSSVPVAKLEAAPTPLVLELEAAISSERLLEPKNASAWDMYQKLASDPASAADAARVKPLLADALALSARAIVTGDVRADNIADRVDDFRRAGQMLARARSLKPESAETAALEKLSAAQALLALQFFDEAERTLMPLQNSKLAAVENALGLAYQGKLDTYRAERAFKRASEIDAKWATPHYNLALLYRSQQNDSAVAELEQAATLDQNNPNIFIALGDEYFSKQQWPRAADMFRKAIALKPSDDALHTKLGHALYSQGLQEEANREYQKARQLRVKQP